MTRLYFALAEDANINNQTFKGWDLEKYPLNFLVAFPFMKSFYERKNFTLGAGRTMLDSGAYSVWKSGKTIDLAALVAEAKKPHWDEAVALDVIGDDDASVAQAWKMRELMGDDRHKVMPVFHYGDKWESLEIYKKLYTRIGLSCRFGEPVAKSLKWLHQCFARAYPAQFHSFGWVQREMLMEFPFATADTASWHASARFGRSNARPGKIFPRKSQVGIEAYNLAGEIQHFFDLQTEVATRWAGELSWTQSSK